jgi:hypothetical protein
MRKAALTLASLGALVLILGEAPAAGQGAPTPATPPSNAETASPGPKPEPPKPVETSPGPAAESPAPQPESNQPASLAEMTREGFEIRATTFVPAEAVTRQTGKVASDAVIMTLQKAATTAVCFYTLKAYVGKKLGTIPACTVHR